MYIHCQPDRKTKRRKNERMRFSNKLVSMKKSIVMKKAESHKIALDHYIFPIDALHCFSPFETMPAHRREFIRCYR